MMENEEKIKNSKVVLGEKIPCSIEVLTPVHIGSGVKLARGIDFITTSNTVTIVPQADLMKYFETNLEELQNFINGGYKLDRISIDDLGIKYPINGERVNEIYEFERNGFGKPYIPGSSMKGAIRTILLKKRFDELDFDTKDKLLKKVTSNRKEWASEPITKELFGETSNENLMRVLEIFDAEFDTVTLEKVFILSLDNPNGTTYKWKKMGRNAQNQINPSNATAIFVEALPIGSKSYTSISINKFLFNNPQVREALKFADDSLSNINDLVAVINNYSLETLKNELSFISKLKPKKNLSNVINNINGLIKQIKNIQKDEFILRISWGSGWKGMTGDFLDNNRLQTFRSKYNLGKNNFTIFPKTRRIVFVKNEPEYLTGWIKIKLNDKPLPKKSEVKKDEYLDSIELLKKKFRVIESKKK